MFTYLAGGIWGEVLDSLMCQEMANEIACNLLLPSLWDGVNINCNI